MGIFDGRRRRKEDLDAEAAVKERISRVMPLVKDRRLPEVEAELRECLGEAERRFGAEHAVTRLALCQLSIGLLLVHRAAEAEPGFRRLLQGPGRAPLDQFTTDLWQLLAGSMYCQGCHEDAAREYEELGNALSVELDSFHPLMLRVRVYRAFQLCHLRRFEEAEAETRAVSERSVHVPAATGFPLRWDAAHGLSYALTRQGRPKEGESVAREALTSMPARQADSDARRFGLGQDLAYAFNAQGRHTEALDCVRSARTAFIASPAFDPAEASTAGVPTAEALLGLARHEEAAQEARATITTLTELYGPGHGCVRDAAELLRQAGAEIT
ncbi:hypothetical protein [Streptomyces sp. MBT53]|uniref:hypothetical protein n=1 Tax=Streptomyces sp. MBT53 TaxID=1488384 RepID=UPI001914777E|nr:hypothetical protein [Streptomyces sp. MBT53]MBK6010111.1 hypothetical protein [Streptomyces sp. MBT53]